MMLMRKTGLSIATAGVVTFGAASVYAVDFNATTTLQNTLAVTVVNDFDIGAVFATETAQNFVPGTSPVTSGGVGAVTIAADGTATNLTADSVDVTLTSLGTPTPAQGSVDVVGNFTIVLPDTSTIDPSDFPGAAGVTNITTAGIPLVHESANPAVPNLYMMHFVVEAVSGGTVDAFVAPATPEEGIWSITQGFGETSFVFNIGATITTQPNDSGEGLVYQEGTYSGTFPVTASY